MKTPQQSYPALAAALGVPEVYLKREDLHHYGSHKGRSIPYMVDVYHRRQGARNFVISSSGNAALAAALMVASHNANNPADQITLKIFVGKKIAADKFKLLAREANADARIVIVQTENPKQQAWQTAQSGAAQLLRQSTDELALVGYHELAHELLRIPNLVAIFVPTSSGTTAQALGEPFARSAEKPQIHIVQTVNCHPMADALSASVPQSEVSAIVGGSSDEDEPTSPSSTISESSDADEATSLSPLAGAIVDKVAARKEKVVAVVQATSGAGWIVNNDEIRAAIELVKRTTDVNLSANSALAVAGLTQAVRQGHSFSGAVACLITGR